MSTPYNKVSFQTLGCKLNFAETSTIARDFVEMGYAKVSSNEIADIYVINTCSVTENANKKARKLVRQALNKSPNAKIVIIGCYAQLKPYEISKIPGVTFIAGTEEKFNLVSQIELHQTNDNPIVLHSNIEKVLDFKPSHSYSERTRSFLKIQDGCDYNCSFCTIPLARGKSRSGTIKNTIIEANKIAKSGVREIVLTGVNIGDFGIGLNQNLFDLIKELDKVEGVDRYRISSIEPNLLSDDIINFISKSNLFLPHFHIPLQSGSDEILQKMRRRYNTKLYSEKIEKIKSVIPNACIGVDIIAGFPGEEDEHFQNTYDFIKSLNVSYLHVFPYSERNNTDAKKMDNKVPYDIILERSKKLNMLSAAKKNEFYNRNLGQVKNVLIESYIDGYIYGHTENYIPIKIMGSKSDINKILSVKLTQIINHNVIGEVLI